MMTAFEAAVGTLNFAGPQGQAQVRRIYATRAWVLDACARDGHPAWLIDLVIERVERDLMTGQFPLLLEETIQP